MNECNSIKPTSIHSNLINEKKFKLNENNTIKGYFDLEIQERKIMNEKLSKYNKAFHYFDNNLIALSTTSGGNSIISFVSVIGAPAWIASASFSLIYFLTSGIMNKLLETTRIKKKKHKIFMLVKSRFNSIEILISQLLIDLEISHKEFKKIVNEKGKYGKMKKKKLEWWKVMMKYELNEYKTINRENQENA